MSVRESFVALVPMKGHSERIPGKNLKSLCDRPLFHWILTTLTSVDAIASVVVNTDSLEIARQVEASFDVTIHERPESLRGDLVSVNRLIEYDIGLLPSADRFVQTHATNPLLRAVTLEAALNRFITSEDCDSVFAVTRHQGRFYDADGNPLNHNPGSPLERTQDLKPIYEDNSNFYIFSRASFAETGDRIGAKPELFEISPLEAVDIDDEADWRLAELLLKQRLAKDRVH